MSRLGAGSRDDLVDRDLVPVDARDLLAESVGGLAPELVRALLTCAERVPCVPEGDRLGSAAPPVREGDDPSPAADVGGRGNDLLLDELDALVDPFGRALERAHPSPVGSLG